MIKIEYEAAALQPIHTGSDEDSGTVKTLRREKVAISKPISHVSWFKSENSRRIAVLWILEEFWKKIDFENMSTARRMKIWDEFSGKMLAATRVKTRFQFLNEFAGSFNIKALSNPDIGDLIQRFSDEEFLTLLRDEQQFLILILRNKRQISAERYKEQSKKQSAEESFVDYFDMAEYGLPCEIEEGEEEKKEKKEKKFNLKLFGRGQKETEKFLVFTKTFDRVPYISGNSIRGIMRRMAMFDFCQRVGIEKLKKAIYHQLFTGGNITDSTIYEDIVQREKYITMCPMIGLFGSAIGNMTITGELKVGALRPICKEHNTGEISFWELIGFEFGTRRDDAKTERGLKIINPEKDGKKRTDQMKYGYETFIKGTRFNHQFICSTYDKLIESAFWHMLKLFKEECFVGGMSAVGNGQMDLDYKVEKGKEELYLNYLEEHKTEIQEYFEV